MNDTTTAARPAHTPGRHPSETPEYWDRLARDERAFATEPWQTVESRVLHLDNAQQYEAIARKLRDTEVAA